MINFDKEFLKIQGDILKRLEELKPFKNTSDVNSVSLASLFSDCYKDEIIYNADDKMYMYLEDGTWKPDGSGAVVSRYIQIFTTALYAYSLTIQNADLQKRLLKAIDGSQRYYMMQDARSYNIKHNEDFDKDPYILNTPNGLVDLKTMELIPHNANILCQKCTKAKFNPTAQGERWDSFILEICSGDRDKATYLQRVLGYSLIGLNPEEKVFFFGTQVRSGKSTLLESVANALGNYAAATMAETFELKSYSSGGSGPEADVARLRGARFVRIPETEKKMKLNNKRVKAYCGNDKITTRALYEKNVIEFYPTFTMYFNTNRLPVVTDFTMFTSKRIVYFPFNECFEDVKDVNLKELFRKKEYAEYILQWLLEGLQMYWVEGLNNMPEAVETATREYEQYCDTVGGFVKKYMAPGERNSRGSDAYEKYKIYCDRIGAEPEDKSGFYATLKDRGLMKDRANIITAEGQTERVKNVIIGMAFRTD